MVVAVALALHTHNTHHYTHLVVTVAAALALEMDRVTRGLALALNFFPLLVVRTNPLAPLVVPLAVCTPSYSHIDNVNAY